MAEAKKTPPPTKVFTRLQWKILIVLSCCNFMSAVVQSLQAPFFPAEANKKGASSTEFGFVFGVYSFVVFAGTPIITKLFRKFRPLTSFLIGYLTVATTTTLFGFLDKIDDHTTFITLAFVLRIFEACGEATVFISNYTFITSWFPGAIGTAFAVMETSFCVGYSVGPAYGGILYQIGGDGFGFTLPFLVTGGLVSFTSLVAASVLPKIEQDSSGMAKKDESKYGFFALIKFPIILIYAIAVMSSTLCAGFIDSTLEPHLRQFSLTPVFVGLVFLTKGVTNAITASFWGLICDRIPRPEYITLTGVLLMFASFITIGPSYFLPIESSLALTTSSLAVFGLGNAAISVSTFLLILAEAKKNGFPDTVATGSACTGLWLSSVSFGGIIGPSLGGLLLDAYGFRAGTVVISGLLIIMSLIVLGSICARRKTSSSPAVVDDEKVHLLDPKN